MGRPKCPKGHARVSGEEVSMPKKEDYTPEGWEKYKAYMREYYAKNKAQILAAQKEYRERNKAYRNTAQCEQYAALSEDEKEARRQYGRKYYRANKHKWAEYNETRRESRKRLGDLMEEQGLPRRLYQSCGDDAQSS
jgi:hypothetical protein